MASASWIPQHQVVLGDNRPILQNHIATLRHWQGTQVFPASGNRNGTGLNNRGSNGNYWSASLNSQTNGYNLNFNSGGVNPANNNNRFNGFSVRAVQHLSIIISRHTHSNRGHNEPAYLQHRRLQANAQSTTL